MKTTQLCAICTAAIAGFTTPAHAFWTSSTSGATTTYTENFNGGSSFTGGDFFSDGGDGVLYLHSTASPATSSASYSFTFLTDITAVALSFWYSGTFTLPSGGNPVGSVSVTGPSFSMGTNLNAVNGVNPGPGVGNQFVSPTFNNLLAGTYTFTFAHDPLYDNFKVDDLVLSVTAVPEPGTWALMLAGLGVVGFVAGRRRPSANAA